MSVAIRIRGRVADHQPLWAALFCGYVEKHGSLLTDVAALDDLLEKELND
jgi:hypothetical protein